MSQSTRNNKGHTLGVTRIQMLPCTGQRGNRRHRNVVAENQRRGTGAATTAIETDVVNTDLECGVDVLLDMLSRQLEANRNATGLFPDLGGKIPVLAEFGPVRKPRR